MASLIPLTADRSYPYSFDLVGLDGLVYASITRRHGDEHMTLSLDGEDYPVHNGAHVRLLLSVEGFGFGDDDVDAVNGFNRAMAAADATR